MDLRRATMIAACMLAVATGPAAAQAPWPTQQQSQQAAPTPWGAPVQQPQQAGPSPWSPQPQQPPPCVQAFFKLRDEASKRAGVIRVASEKHNATAQQACAMFNAFSAAEAKMIKDAVSTMQRRAASPRTSRSTSKKKVTPKRSKSAPGVVQPPPRRRARWARR